MGGLQRESELVHFAVLFSGKRVVCLIDVSP